MKKVENPPDKGNLSSNMISIIFENVLWSNTNKTFTGSLKLQLLLLRNLKKTQSFEVS